MRKNEICYVNFYTVGSAAYQVSSVQKKRSVKLPRKRKQPKKLIYLDPLTVVGFAVAFVMLISMTVGLITLGQVSHEAAVMEQYVQTLKEENASLEAEYRNSYDIDQIRAYANAMGLVPADQVQRIPVQFSEPPQQPQQTTVWEEFCLFLVGLFA